MGVIFAQGKTSYVFFCGSEFCRQRGLGRDWRRHADEGEAPARIAFCVAADTICDSSIYRGVRLVGAGRNTSAHGDARHGSGVHVICAGTTSFPAAAERAAV